MNGDKKELLLILGVALAMAAIFALDLFTSRGVSGATAYIFPVLLCLWSRQKHTLPVIAITASVLTITVSLLSPPGGELWQNLFNRGLSLSAIAIAAFLCWLYKKKTASVNETTDFARTLLSDSFDAIVTIDETGTVLNWNNQAAKFFGWPRDEALGKKAADLIIPPPHREAHLNGMRRFLTTGEKKILNQYIEVSGLRKDGTELPIELTVSAVRFGDRYTFNATIRDLTPQKELERHNKFHASELAILLKNESNQRKALEIANSQIGLFAEKLEFSLLELKNSYFHTLNCLSIAAEFKDEDTGRHIERISRYSEILGKTLGLADNEIKNIAQAAPMHDIGKVGIPDRILQKPGRLTAEEFELMKNHTNIGARILDKLDAPIIKLAREIAFSHHEKWNGGGYPTGIAGKNIPLPARIVALVDCFDALTSHRVYKMPYSPEVAFDLIVRERGESFDPEVVDAFIRCFDQFKATAINHELSTTPSGDIAIVNGKIRA